MAKTLGSILTLAGGVALVASGVGAVAGLAVFGTTAGIGFGSVGLSSLLTASSILVAAGSLVGSLASPSIKAETTNSAIKTERPPRISAYGRLKLFGAYILYETAGNGVAVDVWAFHDGRIDGIEGWYLGDKVVTRLANGFVQKGQDGAYGESDIIQIGANLGAAVETAHAVVIAALPGQYTNDHRGDGVVTGYELSKPVKAKNYQEVYPAGGPNQTPLAIVIRAQPVFDWRDSSQSVGDPRTWKWSENSWLHIAHYRLVREGVGPSLAPSDPGYWTEISALYTARWNRLFAPTLSYWTAAADDADNPVPLAGGSRVAVGANAGASTVQLDNASAFAVGDQLNIFIAPSFSDRETHTIRAINGAVVDINGSFSRTIPTGSLARGGAGTEPRYRSCVSHRHAGDGSEHKAVLAALLLTCDGWMSPRADGALIVHPGRYYAPTVSIGPDDIISYTVEDGVEDENAVNQINVTYVSAAHDFNTVDTDPWTDEDDIADRGAVRSDDLAPQAPSFSQNRRLAKRKMAQAMAPCRGTFVVMSTAEAVLGERFIMAQFAEGIGTDDEFVAYFGPIEITQLSRNLQTGAISGSWIAADPNIDAWNPATEEGEPAPIGDRVAREPLTQPTIISATAQYSAVGQTPEGEQPVDPSPGQTATGARVLIAAQGPSRDDLTWSARWRVGTSGSWNEREYADADPGPGVSFLTEFVPLASNINVEVAYSVGDGRLSPWSDPKVVNTTNA